MTTIKINGSSQVFKTKGFTVTPGEDMTSRKLDPELKAAWVAALRSGDYEQGRGRLCSIYFGGKASYCCLGVLYEVKHGEGVWVDSANSSSLQTRHGSTVRLPNVDIPEDAGFLMKMNDDLRKSFSEIADYIEGNDAI